MGCIFSLPCVIMSWCGGLGASFPELHLQLHLRRIWMFLEQVFNTHPSFLFPCLCGFKTSETQSHSHFRSEWMIALCECVCVCVCKSHTHRLGCRRFLLAWSLRRGRYHMWRGMCERDSYSHAQISRIIILRELGFSLLVPYWVSSSLKHVQSWWLLFSTCFSWPVMSQTGAGLVHSAIQWDLVMLAFMKELCGRQSD